MQSNKPIIKKWVAALRSSDYKQTKGRLRNGDSFCCLGVLCDLNAKEGHGQWSFESGGWVYSLKDGTRPQHSFTPAFVRQWAGLWWDGPSRGPKGLIEQGDLADLNDDGKTFSEIADVIEREYLVSKNNETER